VGEILFNLALQITPAVIIEQVPFIEGQNEGATGFQHQVDDAHILLANCL
jgi:hypothetical protein